MSQTVEITIAAAGTDTGPFNLFSDADAYVTAFATGIAKSALLAGYTSTVVPDAATIVRVKSNNANCTNYVNMTITTGVPDWQPYGDPYCEIDGNECISYQDWKNMNPNNGGQIEQRVSDTDVRDRNPNWVSQPIEETFICQESLTVPGQLDKYIKQIDTNPCSSTVGAQRAKPGDPYQVNSPDCYVNYYYNMISCSGGDSKVGKSNSALKQGTWVQVQTSTAILSGCYLIPDVAPTNTDIPYDYNLDLLIMPPPENCQAESCQLVIPYLSWTGYANSGDQDPYSEACNSNNPRTHVWTLYTYYTDTLATGTFVYASATAAGSQDQNSPSSPGAFAYGGRWWEVVGGILQIQNNC
jgi:hypothetical protein